ncbi:dolichyl-diphosphooligosaccharide--protein glycosyltransferase subunit 4-like [Delphinus delphis]|uniref:Dolichyl-diphosphooligosaccharide--protein glycosyltransferase subunit 4-like n=1 Tax=Tursiops truncatus TaxID=9739 RepID=A0A6J3S244_TURTR|nr:dolichyl-diphosphooligosaccharide--protein glycosyltransferase subunit 4-like [Tursiops truncatus]XP_059878569.1 dolichyl-diphosphooligosaccharide--protein glycosyltransferase subunit 4-like [Delphinus delphis]
MIMDVQLAIFANVLVVLCHYMAINSPKK